MPTGGSLLQGSFAPFFTHVLDDLAEIGTASFIFGINILRASII